jgi:hypothetical protein
MRQVYLMFKTEDSLEDIIVYSGVLLISGVLALLALLYTVSITEFLGEPLSVILGKDWNPVI